jgi:signal transduction histidine kinase
LLSVKNRVSLFNGSFEIKSAPGKGTAVSILLKSE